MSMWSRIVNVFRGDKVSLEILEEIDGQIAAGSVLRTVDECRDVRVIAWLDSLRADTVFGWRQLWKRKVTSAAAVLSLGVAIGACTSAFRLIDALLLRPLPITAPERLYALFRQGIGFYDGKPFTGESFEYPVYQRMRDAVKDQTDLLAISFQDRYDLTWSTDAEMEKAFLQYVSGSTFGTFGLKPALGRLLTPNDDVTPGASPVAVLSYDYWSRRFGRDPSIPGRRFRIADREYEVVGVLAPGFTGTEPGTPIDIFLPAMMNANVLSPGSAWLRVFAPLKPGASPALVQERLRAVFQATQLEEVKTFTGRPREFLDRFMRQSLLLKPAAAGLSGMQQDYRVSLIALGILVGLVLLIACANVANLMTAQAAARAREMALRVSLGAGRRRLMQLILVESAWLALFAAAVGGILAWWSAPFVAGMIPARLYLPADWRVLIFGLVLASSVIMLFGLAPALRASAVRPAGALKGGDDPHSRHRLLAALIAIQVAFCFLVLFAGGLFISTFNRLSNQPTGFQAEGLLTVVTASRPPQPAVFWQQETERLRAMPGVQAAALAAFPLLSGQGRNGFVSIEGAPPSADMTYFLSIAPGWAKTMGIPLLSGRDFRADDADPGVAIVNAEFARRYFGGASPAGKWFEKVNAGGRRVRYEIVGSIADARYRDMREPIAPTVYLPFETHEASGGGTFIVRASGGDPLALAPMMRRELARAGFRASNIRTQQELIQRQTIRERLLAALAAFFSGVALLLAGIGLYGVLSYSVLQRRREIGIRIAIGARPRHVALQVTGGALAMVIVGAAAGCAIGVLSVRYIASLLYQVKATDARMLALPWLTILGAVLLAAVPAVWRAVRIDPAKMLRSE